MYLWALGNPDLARQLVAAQHARAEVMSRSGYLVVVALERAFVGTARILVGGFTALKRAIVQGRRRRQAIKSLQAMDDRLLTDIGISRGEIGELVDSALERGPLTLAELRGLSRPVRSTAPNKPAPVAAERRLTVVRELPRAA